MATPEIPNVCDSADLCLQLRPKLKYKAIFGQYKPLETLRKVEWAFIVISTLSTLTSLGFSIERLVILPKNSDDYTFTIMVCFTTLVSFYYITHGVLKERWPELLVFIAGGLVLTVYLILNVVYSDKTPALLDKQIRLGIGVFFFVVIALLGGWLVRDYYSRHEMVCTINCRADMVGRLKWFFFCASLITLDWQLQASMIIFALENGFATTPLEIIIMGVGAAVITLWVFAGYLTIYKESKAWLGVFIILWIPSFIYAGYKCYRLYKLAPVEEWTPLYQAIVACVVVSIATKLVLAVAMVMVVRNFGHGLKQTLEDVPNNHRVLINDTEEEEETRRSRPAVSSRRCPRLPCSHGGLSPEIRRLRPTNYPKSPYGAIGV